MANDDGVINTLLNPEFQVQAASEIAALLQLLQSEQARVTLSNETGVSLPSRLCMLDATNAALSFEALPDDPLVRELTASGEITATAYLDDIRIQFELDALMLVNAAAGAVLRGPWPGLLYRFQRRSSFRVRPNSRSPQVRVPHPQQQNELRVRILDLSMGGLALLIPPELSPWATGTLLSTVHLELDHDTHLQTSLRVQHVHLLGETGTPVGLAFAQLDAPAARELQLYIDQAQKRSRLLRRD
jgi:c-di-GMP-binding flagellar brake protein YcgR